MFRVGLGYDLHRLIEGRPLILGGVEIPYQKGLEGYSDADVLLHALMDALLGAAALGDIGYHFPPGEPRFAGISSLLLLEEVKRLLKGQGYRIINADIVVIAEAPRLAPYIDLMREKISSVLEVEIRCISVKATTTEGVGACGKGEAISAQAIALLAQGIDS